MTSPLTLGRVSVLSAYLWLALSFQLFFVTFLAVMLSPFALIYAVLGVVALVLAAILLTQQPSLPVFIISAIAGLLATIAGLAAVSRGSLIPLAFVLAFTATSIATTIVSAAGARLRSRRG